jgi:hypothetical protein
MRPSTCPLRGQAQGEDKLVMAHRKPPHPELGASRQRSTMSKVASPLIQRLCTSPGMTILVETIQSARVPR